MKKYNTEKVLYLASGDRPLHVSPKEYEINSDLSKIVDQLCSRREIKRVGLDDAGEYYIITTRGMRKLLTLQIEWRKRNGKDFSEHRAKLDKLLENCND